MQLQFVSSGYNAEDSSIKVHPTLERFANIPAEAIN